MTYLLFLLFSVFLFSSISYCFLREKSIALPYWLLCILYSLLAVLCYIKSVSDADVCLLFFAFSILFYAAVIDIDTHEMDNALWIMLLCLSIPRVDYSRFYLYLLAVFFLLLPSMIVSFSKKTISLGGADIKLSIALLFFLGPLHGIFNYILGLLSFMIFGWFDVVIRKKRHVAYPLIPFFALSSLLFILLY